MTLVDERAEAGTRFTIERTFDAPRAKVWDAWTKPDLIAKWFGPKGVVTTVLSHDLRPGGIVLLRMDRPDGGRMWARFAYREIDEPSRLVWVQSFADEAGNVARSPFPGPWPLQWLSAARFEDRGSGTKVTLTWTPIDAAPDERDAFLAATPSMNEGWSGSFEKLDDLLAAIARS